MKVVAPIPKELRGRLLSYPRLYAYPKEPEPPAVDQFVIIDSGASALSHTGEKIGAGWMKLLARHYEKYKASDEFPILAIAPDVALDPQSTMDNWNWWHKHIGLKIVPVIQFPSKQKKIPIGLLLKQAGFYKPFKPNVICLSNAPNFRSVSTPEMAVLAKLIKQSSGATWIHLLGAGFNYQDVKGWLKMGINSVDSVAYYTDAQRKRRWRLGSAEVDENVGMKYEDLATFNFEVAYHACIT